MEILITGDIERPSPQTHNILWLYELIAPLIRSVTGNKPRISRSVAPKSLLQWIEDEDTLPEEQCPDSVIESITEPTIIVGFELSKRTIFQAAQKKIPCINVGFHPVRFGVDLYMGLECNWRSCIEEYRAPNLEIAQEVSLIRAAMAHKAGIACPPGSVLVVGQTPYDRSLIQNGVLMSLPMVWREFKKIASNSSAVLYKPHPLDSLHNDEITKDYFGLFKGVTRADSIPIYRLLSEPNIKAVIGMSSSVLCEATYFGKESFPLMDCWWKTLVPIHGKHFLSTEFWSRLLKPITEVKPGTKDTLHSPNLLRRTSGGWWGYQDVMQNG